MSKGHYTHNHEASHGHDVNPHSHSAAITLQTTANQIISPSTGNAGRSTDVAKFAANAMDPTEDISGGWISSSTEGLNYNRNSYGKKNWVPMSSHSHANVLNSTSTNEFTGYLDQDNKGETKTLTQTGSNFYSHVNVRLCRRSGQLRKETAAGTFHATESTTELPSTIALGYTEAITSLPTSFAKADDIYQGSSGSMSQGNAGIIRCTGVLNSPITSYSKS